MQPELERNFTAIEAQRAALMDWALALTDAQLDWTLATGAWSLRQIVEHLVLTDETLGQAYAPGTLPPDTLPFRLLPRAWRRALVLNALRRDKTLPLPSPDISPSGSVSLPALFARWEQARAQMRGALERAGTAAPAYSHPVVGPLTAPQMLALDEVHTAYHMRQFEKVKIEALTKP